VFTEDFTGPAGDPWPARWRGHPLGGLPPLVTLQADQGQVRTAGAPGEILLVLADAAAENLDQVVRVRVNNNTVVPALVARRTDADPNTWYEVRVSNQSTNPLRIRAVVGGAATTLGQAPNLLTTNEDYLLRFQVRGGDRDGTDLRAKLWPAAVPEPAPWALEVLGDPTGELQRVRGRFGLKASVGVNGRAASFDDYRAVILPGGGEDPRLPLHPQP
jgi:hypothetical protein